jgi:quercetin dioxygenase-like cupin family protein
MILIANNSNNNPNTTTSKTSEDDLFPKCNLHGIIFKTIIPGVKTGYEYSILEILFPEGDLENEIPLHIQSKEIVIVYVIEGNFKIIYGQQDIESKKGMFLKLEKDIARSFKRIGNDEGKLLVIYIPAGFENFFKDISSMNIEDFRHHGIDDPVLIQLLEKNYGARVLFDEP